MALGEGKSLITVGPVFFTGGEKPLPGHLAHDAQHSFGTDPPGPELTIDHPGAFF